MSKIISKLFVATILLALMPVVCADGSSHVCDDPTYFNDDMFQPNLSTATVDGINDEWNTDVEGPDFFKEMKDYGEKQGRPVHLSNAYLRYDDVNQILYVMVLLLDTGVVTGPYIDDNYPDNHSVMEICVDGFLVNGSSLNFSYIESGGNKIGWEASADVESRIYKLKVETQLEDGVISSMGRCIDFSDDDPEIPIPEFPTISLPIAAILGLTFILQSRRGKED